MMKKLLSVFAVLVVMLFNMGCASACENPPIPFTAENVCHGKTVYVALTEEYHELAGITSPCETVEHLGVQSPSGKYVRGIQENGNIIRVHANVEYMLEHGIGLTALDNVTVHVDDTFHTLVAEIVARRIGEGADANEAANVMACTLWRPTEDSVAHIFFTSRVEHFAVGKVIFNGGRDVATLYAGDFDGDGTLELGFAAGWTEPPKRETPCTPSKAPCKKKCNGGGCSINIEIKMCVSVRVNVSCMK
jgi:hypothetical protein